MSRRPSRRAILRMGGALAAAPLASAVLPRHAFADDGPVKRLICVFSPNGMCMPAWTPPQEGEDLFLSPTLAPLEDFRDRALVLSGLNNLPIAPTPPDASFHARGTAGWLTGRSVRRSGTDLRNGISLDQRIAQRIGDATRLRSLELGVPVWAPPMCDQGYSCVYLSAISWAGPATPLPKLVEPRQAVELLFGATTRPQDDQQAWESGMDRVLAAASDRVGGLSSGLSPADAARLGAYRDGLGAVRESLAAPPCADSPDRLAELATICTDGPECTPDIVRAMTDLTVAAMACDQTRVATLMLGDSLLPRYMPFVNDLQDDHHSLSHREVPGWQEGLEAIDRWTMEQVAYLLEQLEAHPGSNGGTLLDETVVLFGSEFSDGWQHSPRDIPTLLVGGPVGLTGHWHMEGRPLADLHLGLLRGFGINEVQFGDDGTQAIDVLL